MGKIKLPSINQLRRRADKVEKVARTHRRRFFRTQTAGEARVVRSAVVVWFLVIVGLLGAVIAGKILTDYTITTTAGVPGGSYVEGIVGEISSFNPILAETEDEKAVSSLMYSSLLKTDRTNTLAGDLASSWTVSGDGLVYTVKIREDAKWQGGDTTITADDVLFTINLIKDPLLKSPLADTWRSIRAEKVDGSTLTFSLRTPVQTFPWALTFGVLPKAELQDIKVEDLREYLSEHNITGSGPFAYRSSSATAAGSKILLFAPNSAYYGGKPQIDSLHITTYEDIGSMVNGFRNGEINVATGINVDVAQHMASETHITPIFGEVMALFNLDSPVLSDVQLRRALRLGIDRDFVRSSVAIDGRLPNPAETPLAANTTIDYLVQPAVNPDEADKLLSQLGYVWSKDLNRTKDGVPLRLNIATVEGSDYEIVAKNLADQWRRLGIEADVTLSAKENIQENVIIPRNYDVLVYQLQLGGDGDVYAYWHSSGAKSGGLNLSAYKSPVADLSLTRARTQLDMGARETSFRTFVTAWLEDAPAIALYQANLYYLRGDEVRAWGGQTLIDKSVRFRNVGDFTAKTTIVNKTP